MSETSDHRSRARHEWPRTDGRLVKEFTLEYVTTTAHDKELDAYTCSANLVMTSKTNNKKTSSPMTFDVRKSASDPTQFVVQVYGLR